MAKPSKKTKKTKKQTAKQKELNRIKRFVTRSTKRGYVFEDLPDFKTLSLKKLKGFTPDELYKRAVKVIEETGEIIKGTTARKIERREAAIKAAATRRLNKALADISPDEISEEIPFNERALFSISETEIVIHNLRAQIENVPLYVTRRQVQSLKKGTVQEVTQAVKGAFAVSIDTSVNRMLDIVNEAIQKFGSAQVAQKYQENAGEINAIIEHFHHYGHQGASANGSAEFYYTRLATLLAGAPLSSNEAKTWSSIQGFSQDIDENGDYE